MIDRVKRTLYNTGRYFEEDRMQSFKKIDITVAIKRIRILTDPEHDMFTVIITKANGEWRHTAGSENDLDLFLKGARAGLAMENIYLPTVKVPKEPSVILSVETDKV